MKFEGSESIIYSDTPVPDIFLTEYMPSMKCEYVKLYLYCLFLLKRGGKKATVDAMSKKLDLDSNTIREGLLYLESIGLITKKDETITITDIKQKEIDKIYRMKTTSTPEEAEQSSDRNKKRNLIISAINNSFFQGVMSPTWYTDIDSWFDKFRFEEDVMYSLFQYCFDHKALTRNYLVKVAENWHSKGITNAIDLDKYFIDCQRCWDVGKQVGKKLRLGRYLTEYEEEYIAKWVLEFGYDFKLIELALKRTTGKFNPSFKYIDGILCDWNKRGLKDKEAIAEYEKAFKATLASSGSGAKEGLTQKNNFEQRKYDEEFLKSLSNDLE